MSQPPFFHVFFLSLYIPSLDRLSRPSPYLSIMPSLHHNMSVSLGAPTLNLSIIPSLSESLHQRNLLTLSREHV